MKRSLKYFTISFYFLTLFSSCEKKYTSTQLNPFYKLKMNGVLKTIDACGTSDYVAEYLKDTAVFAGFGCGGQRAGFYLKGQTLDGTYLLDNKNSAWYDEGTASYQTDSLNKGTLTITSSIFQLANGGRIPIVEGTFSFDAIDKNTGQKIKVTSGKYLLKKYQY
jgi:hypothetical protein